MSAGRGYRLDAGECLLGRRLDCHICTLDQRISRLHARIRRGGRRLRPPEDLGSCNGSFVNGRRTQGSLGAAVRRRGGDRRVEVPHRTERRYGGAGREHLGAHHPGHRRAQLNMIEVAHRAQPEAGFVPGTGKSPPGDRIDPAQARAQAPGDVPDPETVAITLDANALLEKVCGIPLEVFPQVPAVAAVTFDQRSRQLRTQVARRRSGARDPGARPTYGHLPAGGRSGAAPGALGAVMSDH
ncbi:MAG: FHA domain-containing protein [Deltaproteobacteria bacterium]|nr:FHA domain-containing protein [Deltaproteobacteria bacterium]